MYITHCTRLEKYFWTQPTKKQLQAQKQAAHRTFLANFPLDEGSKLDIMLNSSDQVAFPALKSKFAVSKFAAPVSNTKVH
jgi:hypothetical protein